MCRYRAPRGWVHASLHACRPHREPHLRRRLPVGHADQVLQVFHGGRRVQEQHAVGVQVVSGRAVGVVQGAPPPGVLPMASQLLRERPPSRAEHPEQRPLALGLRRQGRPEVMGVGPIHAQGPVPLLS